MGWIGGYAMWRSRIGWIKIPVNVYIRLGWEQGAVGRRMVHGCLEMYLDMTFLSLCCCLWSRMCGVLHAVEKMQICQGLGQSCTLTVTSSLGQIGAEVSTETSQHLLCPQNLVTGVTTRLRSGWAGAIWQEGGGWWATTAANWAHWDHMGYFWKSWHLSFSL